MVGAAEMRWATSDLHGPRIFTTVRLLTHSVWKRKHVCLVPDLIDCDVMMSMMKTKRSLSFHGCVVHTK